jgi:hypothetical protein
MDIFRDEVHIATYDPVEEEVTYTDNDHKRFRKPVADYLKANAESPPTRATTVKIPKVVKPAPVAKTPEVESEATDKEAAEWAVNKVKPVGKKERMKKQLEDMGLATDTKVLITGLKRENMRLQIENVKLQDEVAKLRGDQATSIHRTPERYSDKFDDSEGVDLKGPHGDMTPAYVEWARENMPKEIFSRRYRGRLKE